MLVSNSSCTRTWNFQAKRIYIYLEIFN